MPGMIQPERQVIWSEDGKYVNVVRSKSVASGDWNVMEFGNVYYQDRITRAQWDAWQAGQHIQHAMPQLGPEEREFLMSGITPTEWNALYPPGDN